MGARRQFRNSPFWIMPLESNCHGPCVSWVHISCDNWQFERIYALVPAQPYIGNWLLNFRGVPPRQKPGCLVLTKSWRSSPKWRYEIASWESPNIIGAWKSPLKLVFAGFWELQIGAITRAGETGQYWSSTANTTNTSKNMVLAGSKNALFGSIPRALGISVRCIKD
jgi:hypothetical protein